MTRDEIFIMSIYSSPPEDIEMADQRMQLLFAKDIVPKNPQEADERMKLAGHYPTNLIDMVWESPEQFVYLLKQRNYEVKTVCLLDAGDRSRIHAGYAASGKDLFAFILKEMPHMTRVECAKTLGIREEYEQWLVTVQNLMSENGFKDLLGPAAT